MTRNILAVLAILVLAGCTTFTHAPLPTARAPHANEGVVIVSVTSNSAAVGQFDAIQLIPVKDPKTDTGSKEFHVLNQATRGLSRDTALFIGIMPVGDYQLERFIDHDVGKFLKLGEGGVKLLGTVRVQAGKLNDMGRLVITQLNHRVLVGRSAAVISNQELLRRAKPEMAAEYDRPVTPGWIQAMPKEDIAERYAFTHPIGAASLKELPNGEMAAATRMGTVLVRGADGRWRNVSSGRLESLLWVKPYESKQTRLLAVGEFNTLLQMDAAGKLHSMSAGNLPFGNILFLDGSNSAGWFVALQRGDETTLFESASLEAPDWKPIWSEKTGFDFWHGMNVIWFWPYSGGFGYATSKGDIRVYDAAARQWSQRRAPNDYRILRVDVSPNDVIGIVTSPGGGFGGVFSKTFYSRDQGQTWVETQSPFKVKVMAPMFTKQGKLFEMGGVFGSSGIHYSPDEGKTWEPLIELKLGGTLWNMPHHGLFRVESNGLLGVEKIEHSLDDGRTWKIEYSTFDRGVYNLQTQKQ